jgi:drug/metabolite transporter (DMT)-like permease
MAGLFLLVAVTALYSGYNLLVKVSASQVPAEATTTILATICLQLAALTASTVFASVALIRGGQVLQLSWGAYAWAAAAGLCIGVAEIAYFYLFRGVGGGGPMAANVAIPAIVSGTIILTVIGAYFVFGEQLSARQFAGIGCVVLGILLLFAGRGAPTG